MRILALVLSTSTVDRVFPMHRPLFAEQEWTETGSPRAILATRSVAQHDCLDHITSAACKAISTSSCQVLFAWQRRVAIASTMQVTSIPWDDPRGKTSRGSISRDAEKAATPCLVSLGCLLPRVSLHCRMRNGRRPALHMQPTCQVPVIDKANRSDR